MVGSARLQNGHWKSENSWMTTFAFAAPRNGAGPALAATAFFSGSGALFPSFMIVS